MKRYVKRVAVQIVPGSGGEDPRDVLRTFIRKTDGNVAALQNVTQVAWEDLRFPATVQRRHPINNEHPAFDTTTPGLLFRHTATDSVYMIAQLPHAWLEGSALRPHVHWTKTDSEAGGVYWQLEYKWAAIGATVDTNYTPIGSATPSVSDSDTANKHALTTLPQIVATGKKVSAMLLMKLSRVHDNSDDSYGNSARLMEFDIHYQVDSFGSPSEFEK